jgi:hypothetical protein
VEIYLPVFILKLKAEKFNNSMSKEKSKENGVGWKLQEIIRLRLPARLNAQFPEFDEKGGWSEVSFIFFYWISSTRSTTVFLEPQSFGIASKCGFSVIWSET